MIPQPGTWADLEPGAYLKDPAGQTWRVVGLNRVAITVVDRAGVEQKFRVRPPDTPITLVVPTPQEAVDNVANILGGVIIGRY